jgi:hypothetical protein
MTILVAGQIRRHLQKVYGAAWSCCTSRLPCLPDLVARVYVHALSCGCHYSTGVSPLPAPLSDLNSGKLLEFWSHDSFPFLIVKIRTPSSIQYPSSPYLDYCYDMGDLSEFPVLRIMCGRLVDYDPSEQERHELAEQVTILCVDSGRRLDLYRCQVYSRVAS